MTGIMDGSYLAEYVTGLERENERLREQLESIVSRSFRTADKMACLESENAKLRELVARLICHIENPPCESCMMEMSCAGGEGLTNCDEYQFMVYDARKLGVDA